MGFFYGFFCGLLFIPFSVLAGLYYFFNYSESYAERRQEKLEEQALLEREEELDLDDMPSSLYASYLGQRHGGSPNGGNGLPGSGLLPEHLDPQFQFAGWISVKRIPEVDHRIIEPSVKKENKKHSNKNGHSGNRKGSHTIGGPLDEAGLGTGVAGSMGAGAASQDPRFTYLDTQNPHLSLPPCLQARFKDSKYGVVKGATMFIYENELMLECLGVITLPNYQISVPGQQKDSHVFSKRHPIWLKYSPGSTHSRRPTAGSDTSLSAKDYYLSMVSCVDKEDLYFTLLRCAKLKTHPRSFLREIPKRDSTLFDKPAMNTLIRTIHSNEHQFQAAWLNAMLGRIFLGVYKTPQIKDMVFQKMVDKLSRVRLPNFLNDMRMKSVHLGDGVPLITRPKLLTLKPNGDMIMDLSLLYQGGFRAEVEAEAVVTVTKKIQPIKVSLVLVMTLIRLEGRVQVWIKPPPCNRIWYGFYHKPHVEMKIEPVVSDKHITSNLIIKAIENKMLEAIAETMVLPNMDDIPFSDTSGVGGIFGEEISPGGEAAATQRGGAKAAPKRSHSPGPRSATIDVTDPVFSSPRTAIEIPHELRQRPDTMYMSAPLYQNPSGARSHASLGDELMQTNYTYDSQNRRMSPPEEDPMREGGSPEAPRTDPVSDSPEALPSTRTLRVPGGCGIVLDHDIGSPTLGYESGGSNHTGNSTASRLLHRKAAANPKPAAQYSRQGTLDAGMPLSYTTGSSVPTSATMPFQPQGMHNVRTMEEHWSHYGIHEYEPSPPEGGKSLSSKDKRKLKNNKNGDKNGTDGDKVSVHSKDSGDTGSTHTGATRWTENSGQTLLGNSSQSTLDVSGNSIYPPSAKSDKFSLSRMFQGFRKKHTKGSHSGSSFQLPNNNSTDVLGQYGQGGDDNGSILMEESEDQQMADGMPYHSHLHPLNNGQTPGELSNAYLPHFRQKFESTPNLTSAAFPTEPEMGAVAQDGSGLLGYEEYELMPERREGSPVPSVYASSLFGDDPPDQVNNGNGNNKSPTTPQQHHHHILNISPKFGTALRKLRNRTHGGSASSKEDLQIPSGDLHEVLLLRQQQQMGPGKAASENSSQYSLYTNGTQGANGYEPAQSNEGGQALSVSSVISSQTTRIERQEDEQFPNGMLPGPFVPIGSHNKSGAARDPVDPSQPGIVRTFHVAPQIVLQKPSPHLSQSGVDFPPEYTEERSSKDDLSQAEDQHQQPPRPLQYIPERQPLRQQPNPTSNMRVDRNLVENGVTPNGSTSGLIRTPSRPRRHSINNLPLMSGSPSPGNGNGSSSGGGNHFSHFHIHGLGVSPASPLRREFSRHEDDPYVSAGSSSHSPRIDQFPQAPLAPSPLPSPSRSRSPSSPPPLTPPPLSLMTNSIPSSFGTAEASSRGSSAGGRSRDNSDSFSLASTASSSISNSGHASGSGRESSSTATTPTNGHHHSSTFRNILSSLKHKKKEKGFVVTTPPSSSSQSSSGTSPTPPNHPHEHKYQEHSSSQIPYNPAIAMESQMLEEARAQEMRQEEQQQPLQQQQQQQQQEQQLQYDPQEFLQRSL